VKKILKIVFVSYFIFIIGSCENHIYAQKKDFNWPVRSSTSSSFGLSYNATPVSIGYVLLKNGDTLRGRIKLLVYSQPVAFISFVATGKNNKWDVVNVPRDKINYVRLYSDSLRNGNNFTDFVNLENKDLWRLIIQKDSVLIYDTYNPGDGEPLGERMILVTRGKKIKIYGNSIFHTEGISPLLLRFINKRYKENFDTSHFPDDNVMINYILNKEEEKTAWSIRQVNN
jgi:hypothetical protein